MNQKLLVTDREAAAMLSMGRSTFREKVRAGMLPPPVRLGGLTRWRVADLVRAIEGATSEAIDPSPTHQGAHGKQLA